MVNIDHFVPLKYLYDERNCARGSNSPRRILRRQQCWQGLFSVNCTGFKTRTLDRRAVLPVSNFSAASFFIQVPLPIIAPALRQPRNRCEANRTSTAKGWTACAFIWSIPATIPLAPRSSRRVGSSCSQPQHPGPSAIPSSSMSLSSRLCPRPSSPATSSASACTPAMPCAAMRSAAWRAAAALGWSMAEFTPRFFLTKPSSAAKPTP